jgi:photosystem II stability/assembly factor-like uncharacterized protein
MDERELTRTFHAALDAARPTPGAEDRAFAAVAAADSRGSVAGRRLASVAAIALALVVVATLAVARGGLVLPSRTSPAAPATSLPRPSAIPSPEATAPPPAPGAVNVPNGEVIASPSGAVALAGWGATGGVDLTMDGGATWTQVRAPQGAGQAVLDIEWVDDGAAYVATSGGLYRFQPATLSWTLLSSRGDLVRLDMLDRTSGFAVTAAGDVVATRDGGLTFAARDVGLGPVTWIQWVSFTQAWAAGPDGIVATTDGGHTWVRQLSLSAPPSSGGRVVAQVGFRDPRSGFAMFSLEGAGSRSAVVYHSSDGGAHWVAEGCLCTSATVPGWPREAVRDVLFDPPVGPLVVTGPDQAALVSAGGDTAISICTTVDDGREWACRAVPHAAGSSASLAVKGRTWWLVTDAGTSGQQTATSQDAGATWTIQRRP